MANEALINRLYQMVDEIARLGGEQERTSIVPGILVADANPSDLPTGYIKIVNPRDGTYVPCLTVSGLVVSDNDLVNVLFTKGTEPIALSQSAGSPSSSVKVSELWDSNFGAVAWQTDAAGHLSATGKNLTTTGDISANDITASGNVLLTSGATVVAGSGSSNPSLGTEASGGRWGSIFIASGYQINTLASLDISAGAIGSEVVMVRLNNTTQDILYLGSMPSTSDDVDVNINDGQVFIQGSDGKVGINTLTVPHGGIGAAMLALDGADASTAGPHIQITTAADNYPLVQYLNYTHDNIQWTFDGYFDGVASRSSDAGSNLRWLKLGDILRIQYSSGNAQGASVTYSDGISLVLTSGNVGFWTIAQFGSGAKVIGIQNATTNPTTNPTGGGVLYSTGGAGTWRGSGGTVTTFGPAEPHCPNCGRDAVLQMQNENEDWHIILCWTCFLREVMGNNLTKPKWIVKAKGVL